MQESGSSWIGNRQARLTTYELFDLCGGLGPAGLGDVLPILLRCFCKSPRLPEIPPGNILAPLPRTNRLQRAEAGAAELSALLSQGLLVTSRACKTCWKNAAPPLLLRPLNSLTLLVLCAPVRALRFALYTTLTAGRLAFPQVHCISTEFTMRKHGGEKGVPFRVQIDTFKENENGEYTEHLHSASCQIKVFKVPRPAVHAASAVSCPSGRRARSQSQSLPQPQRAARLQDRGRACRQ